MSERRAKWRCQVCGKPLGEDGRLEIMNGNPELGEVGRYPVESEDRWIHRHDGEGTFTGEDMVRWELESMEHKKNIIFRVHHSGCDPNPDSSAYSIPITDLQTFDGLMKWLEHLDGKSWWGLAETMAVLRLWQRYGPDAEEREA